MTELASGLVRHGYAAVARDRAARSAGDDYAGRLLGRRALVVRSREGVRTFYDEAIVKRKGAMPPPLAWLLFGRGAVHGLDDLEHKERKRLLIDLTSPSGLMPAIDAAERHLRSAVHGWPAGGDVCVHDQLVSAYGRAALEWVGVQLDDQDADRWSRRLAAIVDGFGFQGWAYVRAWRERLRCERWAQGLVHNARAGLAAQDDTSLARLAASDLDDRTAGVELLNLVRPTIAVSWLGTFAALRLAEHPEWRERLVAAEASEARLAFAQEVRRTTPFVPALAGRVRQQTEVSGVPARPGQFIVLDVIGVDHDPARWSDPETFAPERFLGVSPGAYDLVPQGGGGPSGHRCPGESLALCLLDLTVRALAEVSYDVVIGEVDPRRLPTLPADGLRIRVTSPAYPAGRA
jgi:fatty-acid peroxygenase